MTLGLDLDGTLISCEPRQSAVLRAALLAHGEKADVAAVWGLKRTGQSTRAALEADGLDAEAAARVAGTWQAMVELPYWLGIDTVLPEVCETLSNWRARGIDLVLVTARSRPEWVQPQLRHLGLLHLFSRISCVAPATVIAEKAAALREGAVAAFVGDSESDAEAAKVAGTPFLGVTTGQRSELFLRRAGVEVLANSFAAIHDAIAIV